MSTDAGLPRPLPPPLEQPNPPCSLCGETTEYDGGRFHCDSCRASWDGELSHLDGYSSWHHPAAPQCPATYRPHKNYPPLAHVLHRCLLHQGHETDTHRTADREWLDSDAETPGIPGA